MDEEDRRNLYLILTLGNDGKILIWELLSDNKELKMIRGMRLLTESVPWRLCISKAKGNAAIGGDPLNV